MVTERCRGCGKEMSMLQSKNTSSYSEVWSKVLCSGCESVSSSEKKLLDAILNSKGEK